MRLPEGRGWGQVGVQEEVSFSDVPDLELAPTLTTRPAADGSAREYIDRA